MGERGNWGFSYLFPQKNQKGKRVKVFDKDTLSVLEVGEFQRRPLEKAGEQKLHK